MKLTPFSKNDIELVKKTVKFVIPYNFRFIIAFVCILCLKN